MRLMAGDCARAGAGAARAPARRVRSRLRLVVMAYLAWGRGLQIIAHSKAAIDGLTRLFSNHPPSIRAPEGGAARQGTRYQTPFRGEPAVAVGCCSGSSLTRRQPMTDYRDPNYRDPNYRDPNYRDPMYRDVSTEDQAWSNSTWGWIAGIAVAVLLLVFIFGSSSDTTRTAN